MKKATIACVLILAVMAGYAQKSGYYICTDMDGGKAPDLCLDIATGELTFSNAVPGNTLMFQKTLSLTHVEKSLWPVNAIVTNASNADVVDVPIGEACEWTDAGDGYICERPEIWNTTTEEMWLEAAFDFGAGQIADKVVEGLVTKAVGHAVPGVGLALGIKTAVDIIGTIPEMSGYDAYTRLLFMNDGEEIDPNQHIPYGEELSLMVFCRPAKAPDGDYASDFATGLTIEKFNNDTEQWETFQSINLMPEENGTSRTYDHLLLAKDPFVFEPGAYRIKVEELTGFSEESYTFQIKTQIMVIPSPETGGVQKKYSNAIGESVLISATPNENWEFVQWTDNPSAPQSRWVPAESTTSEYIAEFRRTDGLVAYYPFDGDALDYSGNGNHGTVEGATLTTGVSGQAYSFDGSLNQKIWVPDNIATETLNSFSFCMWLKANDFTKHQHVFHFCSGERVLQIKDGGLSFLYDPVSVGWWGPECSFPQTEWVCVAGTYDGQIATLYINGTYQSQYTLPSDPLVDCGDKAGIGFYTWDLGRNISYNGKIDEIRFYNRALLATEIQALYQSGQ